MTDLECPGVYILRHQPTGIFYIGSASRLRRRLYQHKSDLRYGVHVNVKLQEIFTEWEDFAIQTFCFNTLTEAREYEKNLINAYFHWEQCCNQRRCVTAEIDAASTSAKMSAARIGLPKSAETKAKMAASSCKRVSIDGVIYPSVLQAAAELGLPRGTVISRIRRTSTKFKLWGYA